MTVQIGQQLGNYRLIRLLGRGGFAEVYLGQHLWLNMQAAIKVLQSTLTEDEEENFLREARTIASLTHPHIVRVLDFGLVDHILYLVMEYAPYGSLRQRHPKGTSLPLNTIISYVRQIADALQYAHDRKLIHRDIKPDNLLLGRNNEVLLSDFGIAVEAHSTHSLNTRSGSGTINYMAPEQIQGKPRVASDQYSLGVIVYEWICGVLPFKGTATEIGVQHLLTSPPSLRTHIPAISLNVEQVVMKALEKDPHQRFENVRAFANAMEQACTLSTRITAYTYHGHQGRIKTVTWSLDSSHIASVSDEDWWEDGSVQIWNAANGKLIYTFHPDFRAIVTVMPFPNTMFIASGKYGYQTNVQIIDVTTDNTVLSYRHNNETLVDMKWSPNGKYITSILGNDRGRLYADLGGMDFAPEGFFLDKMEVRNASTGVVVSEYEFNDEIEEFNFAWSPDSTRIAFVNDDGEINIWTIAVQREVITDPSMGRFPNDLPEITTYPIKWGPYSSDMKIAWSPDGKFIAFGINEKIFIWDVSTGDDAFSLDHSHRVTAITWSPDGRYIVSASSNDGSIFIGTEVSSGTPRYIIHGSSNDGSIMSDYKHRDSRIHIWDTIAKKSISTYSNRSGKVTSLAWSPNAKFIASASEDGTVRIWHAF